ncbi:MAG: histidine kinase [Cyanobacteria bacterium SID2]|nr:histidine kinase [Cyanobacteria bacterium SID2]MBP0003683.1 histidine kinase [Cyanobacteria bacterium SBC]
MQNVQQPDRQSPHSIVALGRTLQNLRESESIETLVQIVLDYIQGEFNYSLIWLGLYDRLAHRLQGVDGRSDTNSPTIEVSLFQQQFALTPGDIMEQVVIQQSPRSIPDLREETRAGAWRNVARQLEVQGTVVMPICYRHSCFGVVLLGSRLWGQLLSLEDQTRLSMLLGAVGTALYQEDSEAKHRNAKRPHEPLLSMMSQLQEAVSLDDRLQIVLESSQTFLNPTRTHVYWLDAEREVFWLRTRSYTPRSKRGQKDEAMEISLQDFGGFYKALSEDRVVAIGEAYSSLKADATSRLMYEIRARSLLAAPILLRDKLLGFLSVEGTEARIWQDEEKQYIRGAAQLVALTTPLSEIQERIAQIELDRDLTVGLTQAISMPGAAETTLASYVERLGDRLQAQHVLVLSADSQTNQFEVVCEYPNPLVAQSALPPLSFVDWQLLEYNNGAISLSFRDRRVDEPLGTTGSSHSATTGGSTVDPTTDMRFTAWQSFFARLGFCALLVGNTTPGRTPEGMLVVAGTSDRSWTGAERELASLASQQIGSLLRQWQLQQQSDRHREVVAKLATGWHDASVSEDLEEIERSILQRLGQVLNSPFLALIAWQPGAKTAKMSATIVGDAQYTVVGSPGISVKKDKLLQRALSRDGILGPIPVERLPESSQRWLAHLGTLSVRVLALRTTPSCRPTSVLLVADRSKRLWGESQVEALNLFGGQLAWVRRGVLLARRVLSQRDRLEPLNWYKQRRFEELYWSICAQLKQLKPLIPQSPFSQRTGDAPAPDSTQELQQVRYQEILRELSETLGDVGQLLKQEQWKLQPREEPISIVRLLKRVLDRVEPTAEKRQIWMQVHREGNATVYADRSKLEILFYEVLMAVCRRVEVGGRIDIWYRALAADPSQFLELSVTDSGQIDRRVLAAFQQRADDEANGYRDALSNSVIDRPPGLNFAMFQQLMREMGGDFFIERIDDGRIVNRLLLRLP